MLRKEDITFRKVHIQKVSHGDVGLVIRFPLYNRVNNYLQATPFQFFVIASSYIPVRKRVRKDLSFKGSLFNYSCSTNANNNALLKTIIN